MRFAAKAVIFDLDGVLVDSAGAVERSWQLWAGRHNIDPQRAIDAGHGRTTLEAIRVIAPQLDALESFAEMEAFEESQIESIGPVNGAPEFVRRVVELGIPWAVVTSGTRRIALPRLQRARIPDPAVVVTADEVTRGKPDPQPYENACSALQLHPWECIVFEDAPAGMLSARRAGARVIAVGSSRCDLGDAAAADFVDVEISRTDNADVAGAVIAVRKSHYRCPCCDAHAAERIDGLRLFCALCGWNEAQEDYTLAEARENVREYSVMYRPSDLRFAPSRHPILGPNGEYAIDRVPLRERAYREFRAFGEDKDERAHLTDRLHSLLAAVRNADALYRPSTL